jgi:hypothetical protein
MSDDHETMRAAARCRLVVIPGDERRHGVGKLAAESGTLRRRPEPNFGVDR